MKTAEQNYRLLQEIEANRRFLLAAYEQNPKLLENAELRIQQMFATTAHVEQEEKRGVSAAKQRGTSLIELIMFIVIVSVALAGILLVMNTVTKGSADPLIHKQALAIAESLLEEVELMPFTFCDPDDANASTATIPALGAGGCAAMVENIGTENDVSRYDASFPFDNVSDYAGFGMAAGALRDITNTAVGPAGYTVTVAVANNGMPAAGASPAIANTEALLITVTVTGPDGVDVVVEGIRTRYSPRI